MYRICRAGSELSLNITPRTGVWTPLRDRLSDLETENESDKNVMYVRCLSNRKVTTLRFIWFTLLTRLKGFRFRALLDDLRAPLGQQDTPLTQCWFIIGPIRYAMVMPFKHVLLLQETLIFIRINADSYCPDEHGRRFLPITCTADIYRCHSGFRVHIINPLTAKLFNLNFHPLEIVSRWRDPQLQVSENYSDLTRWRSTVFKYCWLVPYIIFNMSKRWYLMW